MCKSTENSWNVQIGNKKGIPWGFLFVVAEA